MNFFCKLIPPRASFANDMSADERELMGRHAAHWSGGLGHGRVVAFGLVDDPRGAFGIGILEMADEAAARAFADADPVIRAAAGFAYEVLPMPLGVARAV